MAPLRPHHWSRLWFLYPLLLSILLLLPYLFQPLLVEPARYLELLFASLLLIATTLLLMLLALHQQRTYLWHYLQEGGKNKTGHVLGHLAALLLFAPPAFALGIPSLLHLLDSEPARQEFRVRDKAASYYSAHACDGRIYLAEYRQLLNDSLCDVPLELWEAARRGDHLLVEGERSLLGFKALQVHLRPADQADAASGLPRFDP
ncbi:MAG: hypothetical protein LPK18_05060 [Pseudomonadaceae bacterium]|nr:hypothetical protein [Pseudomonadaceae bacterium]